MLDWEPIAEVNGQPKFKTVVAGSEVTIRFSDRPNPQLKNNIMDILTTCYESRIEDYLKSKV